MVSLYVISQLPLCETIFFPHFLGLFSNVMRDLASMENDYPKWIVLDGDIDPMWIESLNTVMDDNKVKEVGYDRHTIVMLSGNY